MKRLQAKRQQTRDLRLHRRSALRAYDRAHMRPAIRAHRIADNSWRRYADSARGRFQRAGTPQSRPEYALVMQVWRETGEMIDVWETRRRLGLG